MILYWYELKKLVSSLAVWGFAAVCLLFNIFLAISYSGDEYADFVSTVSVDTGYILDPPFYEKLSQFKGDDTETELLEWLKSDTNNLIDILDGYETKGIGESYIAASGAKGSFAKAMRDKYTALQKVVDEKAVKNESLSLYFASATYDRHQQLFKGLTGWLLIEGALIGILLVFLSVGHENNHRTEAIVYSTKKGRDILRTKITVSLTAGLGIYFILSIITLLVYFSFNDYGNIWGSNVSSLFNYRYDLIAGYRPFLTWHNHSVLTYLMAMIGMSAGVIICFSLMAFSISLLMRNYYIGFLVFLVINAAIVVLPMQIPQTLTVGIYARYYSMLTPVWLWLKHSIWFTDGDVDILWPHFETLGVCISFLFLTTLCVLVTIIFRKRDLT
ncbi:MAG: hypothetical protein QM644_17390 [Mobilitalea sp.]